MSLQGARIVDQWDGEAVKVVSDTTQMCGIERKIRSPSIPLILCGGLNGAKSLQGM